VYEVELGYNIPMNNRAINLTITFVGAVVGIFGVMVSEMALGLTFSSLLNNLIKHFLSVQGAWCC